MRKLIFLPIALLGLALSFSSCKKDEPKKPAELKTVIVDATNYKAWVYFSLRQGKVVEVSDPMASNDWDLALHRYDFRTNSGTSGKGKGGAFKTSSEDISATPTIPAANEFKVDEMGVALMGFGGHGDSGIPMMDWQAQSMNYVLTTKQYSLGPDGKPVLGANGMAVAKLVSEGLIYSNLSSMPPVVKLSPNVYLIRCADGSIARFRILSRKGDGGKGNTGEIQFEYIYPGN